MVITLFRMQDSLFLVLISVSSQVATDNEQLPEQSDHQHMSGIAHLI